MTSLQSQRQMLKEQKAKQKKKQITTFIIAAIVLVVAFSLIYFLPRKKVAGPTLGDPEAPVKVEQFSNYTCSHCQAFALDREDTFRKTYIDTGKVYLTYYNYQFADDESANAAEATYCAGEQGKFFEYKKQVYMNLDSPGVFSEDSLNSFAEKVGLNISKFQECLVSDRHVKTVTEARNYAQMQRIQYTPSFIVNGKVVLADELNDAIEAALAESGN